MNDKCEICYNLTDNLKYIKNMYICKYCFMDINFKE